MEFARHFTLLLVVFDRCEKTCIDMLVGLRIVTMYITPMKRKNMTAVMRVFSLQRYPSTKQNMRDYDENNDVLIRKI